MSVSACMCMCVLTLHALTQFYRKVGERYPLGRVGMPIDVANVIVFLASDMSGFMTGNLVMVESGATHTVAVL